MADILKERALTRIANHGENLVNIPTNQIVKEIGKTIGTTVAMNIAELHDNKVTRQGMINWCVNHKIGKKIFGRWKINTDLYLQFLRGETQDTID